jgi:hypothetical protein
MSVPPVDDDELLYRNVRGGEHTVDSPPLVLPEAFFDRARRPSVDRARLCGDNPRHTQLGTDGVAVLKAGEIREIGDVALTPPKAPPRAFMVDVDAKPITGLPGGRSNLAHAEIFLTPASDNDRVFRKLRVALARLANQRPWAIEPPLPT